MANELHVWEQGLRTNVDLATGWITRTDMAGVRNLSLQ